MRTSRPSSCGTDMIRVLFDGKTVFATPLRALADGSWIMASLQHTARLVPGTEFLATKDEILNKTFDEAFKVMPASDGSAELEAAMAKERETLPPVAETLQAIQDAAKPMRQAEAAAAAGEKS